MIDYPFTSTDDFNSLPQKLRDYFPTFLDNRISEVEKLIAQLESNDTSGVKAFCHRNGGIASSYHLHRFSELVEELSSRSQTSDCEAIKRFSKDILVYLKGVAKTL